MEGDLRPSSVDNIESDLPSSKEEVLERIREVKTGSESGLKDYPLYPRRWMEVNATSGIESAKKIRVMQFNILAEGLSAGEREGGGGVIQCCMLRFSQF